ncbi:alpha/beta hydrolase [Pseudopedobacter sp.]|uniref:alpha/beta fold hydrolase n=1 Tax=Pseudopedobacter sp. TaxID=1936787 RepID=UPI00333E9839
MPKIEKQNYKINYVDYGQGQPVVLIHGWPLSLQSWEFQIPAIVEAGYRCIAYDRRGFGKSDSTWDNYDYDSLAEDLHDLVTSLNLEKVILVGFSMGGGEVIRYISKYGDSNISKIALISSIIPLVKQKPDNPDGVPQDKLDEIYTNLKEDRLHFLKGFHKNFYNVGLLNKSVSEEQLDFDFSVAAHASSVATVKAAKAWMDTDFRSECASVKVPVLIIHGKADQTVPVATAGDQAAKLMPQAKYEVYDDGPHGLNVTHKDRLNKDLIDFLAT